MATEKWSTLRPTEPIKGLEAELEESISCEECYPACSDTTYQVQTSAAALSQTPYFRSGLMCVHSALQLAGETLRHLFIAADWIIAFLRFAKGSNLPRYNAVSTGKRLPSICQSFKSSKIWRRVNWQKVTNVSKNISASILRIIQFISYFLLNYFNINCAFSSAVSLFLVRW